MFRNREEAGRMLADKLSQYRTDRDASRLMAEEQIRHLAVTEANTVVGLLSVRDLVKMVSARDKPRFLRKT